MDQTDTDTDAKADADTAGAKNENVPGFRRGRMPAQRLITREAARDIVITRLSQGKYDDEGVLVPIQTLPDFARSCYENGATTRLVSRALMQQLLSGRLYPDLTDYEDKPIQWHLMPRCGRGPARRGSKAQSPTGAETSEPKGEGSQSAEMELIAALQNDVSRLTKELDDLRVHVATLKFEDVKALATEVETLRLRVSELESLQKPVAQAEADGKELR